MLREAARRGAAHRDSQSEPTAGARRDNATQGTSSDAAPPARRGGGPEKFRGAEKFRVGVVSFATRAAVGVPPTEDRELVETAYERFRGVNEGKLADYIPRLGSTALEFQPGSRWTYSPGAGFETLGRVIEIVSGQDYYDYVRRNVYLRGGMTRDPFPDYGRGAVAMASSDGRWYHPGRSWRIPPPAPAPHSSRGPGHRPLKAEITGSNPVCGTNPDLIGPIPTGSGRSFAPTRVEESPSGCGHPCAWVTWRVICSPVSRVSVVTNPLRGRPVAAGVPHIEGQRPAARTIARIGISRCAGKRGGSAQSPPQRNYSEC